MAFGVKNRGQVHILNANRPPAASIWNARTCPHFKLDKKYNRGHTHFMKTAISIPDEVFQSAESLAKRLGMSRSQLYTAAVNEYLNRRQDRQITARLNSIYEEEDSSLPSGIIRLQVDSLSREEW